MTDQPQRGETTEPTAEQLAADKLEHDKWMRSKTEEALKTFNFAHYVNFDVRIDGENRSMEGDWVKPILKRFLELSMEREATVLWLQQWAANVRTDSKASDFDLVSAEVIEGLAARIEVGEHMVWATAAQPQIPEATPEELEPPWDYLDPGIADVVRLLHENGIRMYCSCEGGDGHLFPEPTVIVYDEAQRACQILKDAGHLTTVLRPSDYGMTEIEMRLNAGGGSDESG